MFFPPFLPVYKHPNMSYIGEEGTQLSLFTTSLFELFIALDLLKIFFKNINIISRKEPAISKYFRCVMASKEIKYLFKVSWTY